LRRSAREPAARRLLERRLAAAYWNAAWELALRAGDGRAGAEALAFVEAQLPRKARDRDGAFLDEAGGYCVETLYVWLPLLAKAGQASGDARYFDEACTQLFAHRNWLEDPLTGLWHSAFGRGAHPRRVTPGLWALGNAYCLAGVVGLLAYLPRGHASYVDVVCLARRHVEALHEHLPVTHGWTQLLDDMSTFSCTSATALLTYGCARAILEGWVPDGYWAVVYGGVHMTGELVDREGNCAFSSRPTGGLDTLEAYREHRLLNAPGALGFVLSACAYGALCMRPEMNPDARDDRLGAR